jgi:hypothetical protein
MDSGEYVKILWMFSIVVTGTLMLVALASFMMIMYRMLAASGIFAVVA